MVNYNEENIYKFKDKKLLRTWSKGELINFIFQLIEMVEKRTYLNEDTETH